MNIINIMNSNKNIMNYEPKQKMTMHESSILLLIQSALSHPKPFKQMLTLAYYGLGKAKFYFHNI